MVPKFVFFNDFKKKERKNPQKAFKKNKRQNGTGKRVFCLNFY